MRRVKTWLRARLRAFLGLDATDSGCVFLERQIIATALEAQTRISELAESIETNQTTDDAFHADIANKFNDLCRIVLWQQECLKRWAKGSQVLGDIETKHKRATEGGKILTLPSIVNGN